MNEVIRFFSTKGQYGCFSNFSRHPVELDGKVWKTSEHYYQAQKFDDPILQEKIRNTKTPKVAAAIGRDKSLPIKQNWDAIKENVMCRVLRAKFDQNLTARDTLLTTGDATLIEDSPWDWYWGCGKDDTGKNRLGVLLMELRKELCDNAVRREIDWINY